MTDPNGYTVTYEFTKDSADGSYSYSWNSDVPNDEPKSWFFAVKGDSSTDGSILWSDGSVYLKHTDTPSLSGSVTGYGVFMPTGSTTLSVTFTWELNESFSGELIGRFEGIKEEFIYRPDKSGSLTAKDANENVVGTMTWDSYGVVTYADGVYGGESQPPSLEPASPDGY